ncbi:hypothetical protein MCUN1_003781 [Malassezia cuniculi]|uniref:Uncharacterized protein n=1 Tax=Malassezia cuniculi TaxID=948313 RepID=A0AAF0EXJ9_9BASI|nr:hypothetical protein MCUN1_003781 [Malassezia cuniculi]
MTHTTASDPSNRLFPLLIVGIVVGSLLFLLLLGLVARFCLSHKAPERHIEFGAAEKQEDPDRAPSAMSRLTPSLLDEKGVLAEPAPVFHASAPKASSIGRGIGGRYDSFRYKLPFQLYQDDYYDKMNRDHSTLSSEMPPPVPSKTDLYRMSAAFSFVSDEEHSRQSNISVPCVTKGDVGWDIHSAQSADDDLSFDALPPTHTPPEQVRPMSRTLARPHGP